MLKLFLSFLSSLFTTIVIAQTIPHYVQTSRDLEIFLHFYKLDSIEKLKGRKSQNPYISFLSAKNGELDDSTFRISNIEDEFYFGCTRQAFNNAGLEADLSYENSHFYNGTGRIFALISYFFNVPRSRFLNNDYPFYFDLNVDITYLNTIDKKLGLSNHFLKYLNFKLVKEPIDTCYLSLDIINFQKVNSLKLSEQEFEKQKKLAEGDRAAISDLYEKRNYFQPIFNYWRRLEFASKNLIKMPEISDGDYAFNIDSYLLENCTLDEMNVELFKCGLKLTERTEKLDFYRFIKLNSD